jgi:hypothetical protein
MIDVPCRVTGRIAPLQPLLGDVHVLLPGKYKSEKYLQIQSKTCCGPPVAVSSEAVNAWPFIQHVNVQWPGFYAMLCYAMLCYAMLCYAAMLCYTMLCYAMLCYAMLCGGLSAASHRPARHRKSPLGVPQFKMHRPSVGGAPCPPDVTAMHKHHLLMDGSERYGLQCLTL